MIHSHSIRLETLWAGARKTFSGFTETAMRKAIANRLPEDVISGQRAELMDEIREDLRASVNGQIGDEEGAASLGDLGIKIIDVRIRRQTCRRTFLSGCLSG